MIWKILALLIAFLEGSWLIFDSLYAMRTGKFFGKKPGPWAEIVSSFGIAPLKMKIPFLIMGITWYISLIGIATGAGWGFGISILAAVLTLWYLTPGAVLAFLFVLLLSFAGKTIF